MPSKYRSVDRSKTENKTTCSSHLTDLVVQKTFRGISQDLTVVFMYLFCVGVQLKQMLEDKEKFHFGLNWSHS